MEQKVSNPNPPQQNVQLNFVCKELEFVHPWSGLSEWYVQVQSCVLCSSDSRQSPAQWEAQLWDKEAAYQQKYQLLHTASWRLMGLLWQRDAEDERLVSSLTVKPVSLLSASCCKTTTSSVWRTWCWLLIKFYHYLLCIIVSLVGSHIVLNILYMVHWKDSICC